MNSFVNHHSAELLHHLDTFSERVFLIYERAIEAWHVYNTIDREISNPYAADRIEHLLYAKCWVDTVQWHVEDEIRHPSILPGNALLLKRRIDALNQERTDKVELIDHYFLIKFRGVTIQPAAKVNSESPAWALDRLSILALKIYHMKSETERRDVSTEHIQRCDQKLEILYEQRRDLSLSINELLTDISKGHKYMKVYKQMKMYNDPALNPVLYKAQKP